MEQKPLSTLYYGIVGIAAIGAITLVLLGIIMIAAPGNQILLTSY
jgi:hypothetical protein